MDLDVSARRLAYLQSCPAMSCVAIAVTPTCVAAASDSAGLNVGTSWATVEPKPKLWATDTVVAGVAGVVHAPNIDLLSIVRSTLAEGSGDAVAVAAGIAKKVDATATVIAALASATFRHTAPDEPFCTTIAVAEPGCLCIVALDWHGCVDVTTHLVSGEPVLAVLGARPARVDLVDAERAVVLLASQSGNAEQLADACLNVVTERVHGLILSPPRLLGQPTVTAPIKWVSLTKGSRLSGQMVPPAIDSLRP